VTLLKKARVERQEMGELKATGSSTDRSLAMTRGGTTSTIYTGYVLLKAGQ
jgi:hypothetical protein